MHIGIRIGRLWRWFHETRHIEYIYRFLCSNRDGIVNPITVFCPNRDDIINLNNGFLSIPWLYSIFNHAICPNRDLKTNFITVLSSNRDNIVDLTTVCHVNRNCIMFLNTLFCSNRDLLRSLTTVCCPNRGLILFIITPCVFPYQFGLTFNYRHKPWLNFEDF